MAWKIDRLLISKKYFELININNIELFRIIKENLEELRPVSPLIQFIISRIETVTTLIMNDRLWDAEIILRSGLETFVKFLFITTASKEEREKRLEEYWQSLSEINSIKLSEQAKKNLVHLGDNEIHRLAYRPLVLPEKLEKELREKWTKSKRQKVEQKWSFTEMVNSISQDYHGKPLEIIVTLTHSYRMSSHIMHGDEIGIQIIEEREVRTSSEIEEANAGHFLRLISDCLSYCSSTAVETLMFLGLKKETEFFFKNQKRVTEVDELFNKYKGQVFKGEMYDKYRTKDGQ